MLHCWMPTPKSVSWFAISDDLAEEYGLNVAGVYSKLLSLTSPETNTGSCSHAWLAKKCHLTTRTIRSIMKKLQELELVKTISRNEKTGICTYKVTPIVDIQGRLQASLLEDMSFTDKNAQNVSGSRLGPLKRISRKKSFRTPEEERERQIELDKYLDLIN